MKISEQTCEVKRVYIRNPAVSALVPQIEYIEFYRVNSETPELVTGHIDLR